MDNKCVKDLLTDVTKYLYELSYDENIVFLHKNISHDKDDIFKTSVLREKKVVLDFVNERISEIYYELMQCCSRNKPRQRVPFDK